MGSTLLSLGLPPNVSGGTLGGGGIFIIPGFCLNNEGCDDNNSCTDDLCVFGNAMSGTCAYSNNNSSACSDNDRCTTGDHCSNGSCIATPILCLNDSNPCTDDVCDPSSGLCGIANDSATCDDGDVCSAPDACANGACVSGGGGDFDNDGICNLDDPDDDGDGIADTIEDPCPSAPNSSLPSGDGNGDNILDSLQHNVTSLPAAAGGSCITLVSSCEQNFNVSTQVPTGDRGFQYPFGTIKFSTFNNSTAPCSSADIKMIFHATTDLAGFLYRKHGPTTPGSPGTTAFYNLPGVTLNGSMATFTLTDGQLGDASGVDGQIDDPSGPAIPAPAQVAPVLTSWGLVTAAALLACVGVAALRRRNQRAGAVDGR